MVIQKCGFVLLLELFPGKSRGLSVPYGGYGVVFRHIQYGWARYHTGQT